MRNSQNTQATPETVWALLMETAKRQGETDRILTEKFAETDRLMKENERLLTEKFAETDRLMKETERLLNKKFAETDKKINKVNEMFGSWGNNFGSFAEEYFFNSFENGQKNFFGKRFNEINKGVRSTWQGVRDEYDIVLYNDDAVAIIEVKFKAHVNDIETVLKKAETFKKVFPQYKDYKIYLGLASLSFYPELEQLCIKNGIAIIKQVGDTVVINDEHLKVF